LNFAENTIYIAKHVVIPETQHAIAFGFDLPCPHRVSSSLLIVLTTVQFDNDFCAVTHEVHDEWADESLSAKMRAGQRNVVPEPLPQDALRIGWLSAHTARKLLLPILFNALLDHDRKPPTPDPSPQGGGEQKRSTHAITESGFKLCDLMEDAITLPRRLRSRARLRRRLLPVRARAGCNFAAQ